MIDTKELRRLAQAATPHVGHACKYQDAHWLREGHVDFENADLFIASERPQEDAEFYAAANPATVIELLDRLEAAESDCLEQARLNGMGSEREAALMAKLEEAEKERDWNAERLEDAIEECTALRTCIEEMWRQDPVAQVGVHKTGGNAGIAWSARPLNEFDSLPPLCDGDKLYLAPGAQPAPIIPEGWLRAIDEALVVAHIGVANESDTYEQAKAKLNNLIGFHVDVATDPAVNGGWKLVPIEPTHEMLDAGEDTFVPTYTGTPVSSPVDVYRAMLAAAPESKP